MCYGAALVAADRTRSDRIDRCLSVSSAQVIVNAYFRALEDALVAAEESSFDIDLNNREQLSNLVRARPPARRLICSSDHSELSGIDSKKGIQ